MKELEIKGYPTLIGKDATTGEIKWEKTLKNTLTMHERMWRAYASSINATIPNGDITRIETDSDSSFEGDSMSIIMTLPYRISDIHRFSSTMYDINESNGGLTDSSFSYSGIDKIYSSGYSNSGEGFLTSSSFTKDGVYMEYKSVFGRPDVSRTIGTVLLSKREYAVNSFVFNRSINAFAVLDEEIIQDSNTVIEVYYKFIIPMNSSVIPNYIHDLYKFVYRWGTPDVRTIIPDIPSGIHKDTPYSSIFSAYYAHLYKLIDYSKLSDKYNYINKTNDGFFNDIHSTSLNIAYSRRMYGQIIDVSVNSNNQYGSLISSFVPPIARVINSGSDYSNSYCDYATEHIPASKINVGVDRYLTVFKRFISARYQERPYVDTSTFASSKADISVKIKEKQDIYPEMYNIKILNTGTSGTTKARMYKYPFLGSENNTLIQRVIPLDHINESTLSTYAHSLTIDLYNKNRGQILNHKHGLEYTASGDRFALFDGHILISTRHGVMLTHMTDIDYEIYDKDSYPQLPVSMVSSITHNMDTKEVFIGCANTGLWKLKKNLRSSDLAVITKVSGPDKIYTMFSDKHGNIAVISNRGLEYSTSNGEVWTTISIEDLGLTSIKSEDDLKNINAIAVDFESENLDTVMIYSYRSSYYGAMYSKVVAKEIVFGDFNFSTLTGINNRASDFNIYLKSIPGLFNAAWSSYTWAQIDPVCSIRGLSSVLDTNTISMALLGAVDDPNFVKSTRTRSGIAMSMMKFGNILPCSFITCKHGKFMINYHESWVFFDFNDTKNAEYGGNLSASGSNNGITTINKSTIIKRADGRVAPLDLRTYIFSPSTYSVSYASGSYPTYRDVSIGEIKNCNATALARTVIPVVSRNTEPSYMTMSCQIFEDSGIVLGTRFINPYMNVKNGFTSNTYSVIDYISNTNWINADSVDDYLPGDDVLNSAQYMRLKSYIFNPFNGWNTSTGPLSNLTIKPVLVDGKEEFTISDKTINVDGLEITFDSKGAEQAYIEGDVYNFIKFDGLVNDNVTNAKITYEFCQSDLSSPMTQTGIISATDGAYARDTTYVNFDGNAYVTKDGIIKSAGSVVYPRVNFYYPSNFLFGDFKFSIDHNKIEGAARYQLYWQSTASTTSYYSVSVNIIKSGDTKAFFCTTSNSTADITLTKSQQESYKILDSDNITVEFNSITRIILVKKNGIQVYSSGSLDANTIPETRIKILGYNTYRQISNNSVTNTLSAYQNSNTYKTESNGVSIPLPKFEYSNRGYPIAELGNSRDKSGVYDPRFVAMPCVLKDDLLEITIDGKPVRNIIRISGYISDSWVGSSGAFNNTIKNYFKSASLATGNILPTDIPQGQVVIVRELGLMIFSEKDIGKTYTVKSRWYRDNYIGIGEFEDE